MITARYRKAIYLIPKILYTQKRKEVKQEAQESILTEVVIMIGMFETSMIDELLGSVRTCDKMNTYSYKYFLPCDGQLFDSTRIANRYPAS